MRVLCKLYACLVVMEAAPAQDGRGACPQCGGSLFSEHAGWVECDTDGCSFAIEASDYRELVAAAPPKEE